MTEGAAIKLAGYQTGYRCDNAKENTSWDGLYDAIHGDLHDTLHGDSHELLNKFLDRHLTAVPDVLHKKL